jgi:hypothetical protein
LSLKKDFLFLALARPHSEDMRRSRPHRQSVLPAYGSILPAKEFIAALQ